MPTLNPIRLELMASPVIGSTSVGQKITMGGFSGLRFLGKSSTGLYRFVTHTDRGPNADESVTMQGQERPFGLPEFQPRIVFLEADLKLRKFFISREVPLSHPDGKPVTGLPPETNSEIGVDFYRNKLPPDDRGLDLEGIALASDGTFWMADEYGPSLVQFSSDGVLLNQISPGKGLPEYFRHRRMNRGFESVAVSGGKVYAALESPLDNPPSKGEQNSKNSRFTRLVEVDPGRKVVTAQFAYILDEADTGKLNDITFEGPGRLLALERGTTGRKEWRKLYRLHLDGATNLQRLSSKVGGNTGTLESLLPKDYAVNSLAPVKKELVLDLGELGVKEEKPEGIDVIDEKFVAVIIDNDFGLAGGLDHTNAVAEESHVNACLYFLPITQPRDT
jgi:hypothetical protein